LKKRIFTYEEAVELLPEIRRLTEEAVQKVSELLGPEQLEEPFAVDEQRLPELRQLLEEWAERVLIFGVEIKGLWLVDFDTGSGYYCWKYPEPALEYFHTYEDGFRGRVAIN
jgi:hypothetical protein